MELTNFYDDMVNMKDFDSNLLKLYKKSFKNFIALLHYVTKKINTKLIV